MATMGQNPKTPLLKPHIPKDSKIFLWNSGGKKMQLPKDVIPPKKMVIDDITIYVQMLTSDEAKANGVKGWDYVLDDIKGYKPEVAERKIASFWANWRHSHVMARRFKTPKHTNFPLVPTAEAAGTTSSNSPLDPTAEASGSNTTNGKDTPSVMPPKGNGQARQVQLSLIVRNSLMLRLSRILSLQVLFLLHNPKSKPKLCGSTHMTLREVQS